MRCSALLVVLATACGGDDEPDCPSLGCFGDTGSASTTTSTTNATSSASATTTTSSDPETSGSESGTAAPSTTTDVSETSAADSSSESSTSAPPCDGPDCPSLAECFGLGVWQSCTEYCTALKTTCVAGGCDGATVVYYGDVDACTAMDSSGSSAQGCDDGFDMGGGNSFGRCCCD